MSIAPAHSIKMTTPTVSIAPESKSQTNGNKSNSKKRTHDESVASDPLPLPQQPELPEFNLTSARPASRDSTTSKNDGNVSEEGWQKVERPKKKPKKTPKANTKNYPAIDFSAKDSRLSGQIKISDLQSLVLYILADGSSPQFVSVRHRPEIRKVVVLMVPGLEMSMFESNSKHTQKSNQHRDGAHRDYRSSDDFYPKRLKSERLPQPVQQFADMFEYIWPVKTPGDDKYGKMHSPLHAMLTAPIQRSREDKTWNKNRKGGATPAREPQGWKNNRIPIPELVHTSEELLENEYTLHPAVYSDKAEKDHLAEIRQLAGVSAAHGWVDTLVENFEDGTPPSHEIQAGSITAGREILAMDCEMCMVGDKEFVLTRISIIGWDGTTVLDELVKPEKPITDYLTQYSGITEAMLAPVTTTLADIQKKLLTILHSRTVLIGHSLNSDLNALKITHPFIVDTAIIYPHPRGPPLKSSLKYLAQKYLNREIQKGHGSTGPGAGHDSIEDAKTCLDLTKQKLEKGKDWGSGDAQGENIFKRVARTGVRYKNQGTSAIPSTSHGKSSSMIDWGEPRKGPGAASDFPIGCHSDEEITEAVIRAVKGDPDGREIPGGGVDFVWARFRELEALKGWWNNNKHVANAAAAAPVKEEKDFIMKDEKSESAEETKVDAINVKEEEVIAASLSESVSTDTKMIDETSNVPIDVKAKVDVTVESTGSVESLPLLAARPSPADLNPTKSVDTVTAELTNHIAHIYEQLPPCTALLVYSGSGDPREMSRLQAMQTQFKREYKVKKWDQLSVKWTDSEEQALKRAVRSARDGIAFIGIK